MLTLDMFDEVFQQQTDEASAEESTEQTLAADDSEQEKKELDFDKLIRRKTAERNAENSAIAAKILSAAAQRYGTVQGDMKALKVAIEAQKAEDSLERRLDNWRKDEEKVKELYPEFDLKDSLADRRFFGLLYKGVDLKTAYEAVHFGEILGAAMAYAAEEVRKNAASSFSARSTRPVEGALKSAAGVINEPRKLTKKQRGELINRAARGEKISL